MRAIDSSHDPKRKSWVSSANAPDGDFPIQNLPFCAFRRARSAEEFRGGVAIGDSVLDLGALHELGVLDGPAAHSLGACAQPFLNALMGLGPEASSALRAGLSAALRTESTLAPRLRPLLIPQEAAEYRVAAQVGDYTDFYASIHHATAVGKLLRPDNPLFPNYKWLPVAYHGRASSIRVSGYDFARPAGQVLPPGAALPELAATRRLDYELEVGVFVGRGNELGRSVPLREAESHLFGLCLLNDWSARDIQAWEYQPLGPFLGKSFLTTISPWVVTPEALAPFRIAQAPRPPGDPAPLPYLFDDGDQATGALDIELEVLLLTPGLREKGLAPHPLATSNARHLYWTVAQLLAHHTCGGCNLRQGDIFGTGTISGPSEDTLGSLLEVSAGGRQPVTLPSGETRRFLEDGDTVMMRARCQRDGFATIGFGECCGTIEPAS